MTETVKHVISSIGRIFDSSSSYNVISHPVASTPEEADYWALASDWITVGEDIQIVIKRYAAEESDR